MTAQIEDTLLLEGEAYALVGMAAPLVHPRQFGMTPAPLHARCYRGFHCGFEIADDTLLLRSLTLREAQGLYRSICGCAPVRDAKAGAATYDGLALRVGYGGVLRLARETADGRVVVEVELVDGRVEGVMERRNPGQAFAA
jgi:hypothetical protein